MKYPDDMTMFLSFALCEGQELRVVDGVLSVVGGGVVKQTLPGEVLDELLARGWAEFESDAWDARVVATNSGRHWTERWLRSLGGPFRGKTLAEMIHLYTVRGLKGAA